ncbi:MAG: class I SAM-dependent methyltransferase [Candidatus Limnocylindrales bacterium]
MPFRNAFECLWCGTPWSTRGPDDLEGFAQLCPDCIGRAGDNGFLRFRLKAALDERARTMAHAGPASASSAVASASSAASRPVASASSWPVSSAPGPVVEASSSGPSTPGEARDELSTEMIAYYEARAGEYDDWYLRRGRYARGPVHDQAWAAELDVATLWLDGLAWSGEIVELAAGTGWWSPLLASKGELSIYDAAEAPLDRARDRLLAHRLRAHIHVRDAWLEPDRAVDGLFCGFWLSHVPRARLAEFLGLARRWLKPGGTFAFIDSRPDPQSGADDQPVTPSAETDLGLDRRRIADGREFRVVKVQYEPAELLAALHAAGFASSEVAATPRFFLLGHATA